MRVGAATRLHSADRAKATGPRRTVLDRRLGPGRGGTRV